MNKKNEVIQEETQTFSDRLFEFLVSKRKILIYSSLSLIICVTLLYRLVDGKRQGYEHAIIEAKLVEQSILKKEDKSLTQEIGKLNAIVETYPSLAPLYSATTMQASLLQGDFKTAEQQIETTSKSIPMHFRSFSDASLLITESKLNEALTISENLSLALDQKFSEEEKASSTLYLMNSTRLAFLYQALNEVKLEQSQWKKVLALLNSSKQLQSPLNQRVADTFRHNYSQGEVSIVNYAESRLN